jgi:hypothetical protein
VKRLDRTTVLVALVAAGLLGWLGLHDLAFTDYDIEARPAYDALLSGDIHAFLLNSPTYGGALVLRAPLALLVAAFGGGELAVFRAVALPGLLALALLGVALVSRARAAGASAPAAWLALALCVANPLALRALELGHAEELLAASLVVAAMLAAQGRRPGWAGVLVGLAVATKPWAFVAIPAVIAVLPAARWRAGAIALAIPAAFASPFLIAQWVGQVHAGHLTTGEIFKPWQVWWPLGSSSPPVVAPGGHLLSGYRHSPPWLNGVIHPGIVALSVPLVLLWLRRARTADGLLLLAFLLFLRCLLDPWNNVYYVLPCVLALTALDASRGRAPLAAAAVTGATWLTVVELASVVSPDVQSAAYLAWALPFVAALGLRLYAPQRWARLQAAALSALRAVRPTLSPRSSAPSGTS